MSEKESAKIGAGRSVVPCQKSDWPAGRQGDTDRPSILGDAALSALHIYQKLKIHDKVNLHCLCCTLKGQKVYK